MGPATMVYTSTGVNRRAREVMELAKSSGVVVDDEGTSLKIEPYSQWVVERRTTEMLTGLIPDRAQDVSDLMSVEVDWSTRGGLADDVRAIFGAVEVEPKPHFGATDVHRRTRTVLNAAKKRPVFVDHKQTLLAIDSWGQRSFEGCLSAVLQDVLQLQAARQALRGSAPTKWAFLTPYPWIAALPPKEAEQFADELFAYLLDSVRRGSLESFFGNLRGWQTAAEIHSSRTLQERLAQPLDPSAFVEAVPPAATSAAASE
jgi:hypothetical protein